MQQTLGYRVVVTSWLLSELASYQSQQTQVADRYFDGTEIPFGWPESPPGRPAWWRRGFAVELPASDSTEEIGALLQIYRADMVDLFAATELLWLQSLQERGAGALGVDAFEGLQSLHQRLRFLRLTETTIDIIGAMDDQGPEVGARLLARVSHPRSEAEKEAEWMGRMADAVEWADTSAEATGAYGLIDQLMQFMNPRYQLPEVGSLFVNGSKELAQLWKQYRYALRYLTAREIRRG